MEIQEEEKSLSQEEYGQLETAEKKKQKNSTPIISFFAGALVVTLIFSGLYYFNPRRSKEAEIKKTIEAYYLGDVDEDALTEGMYKGMIESLGDKYSAYYTEEEYNDIAEGYQGTYEGVGIVMQENKDTEQITIIRCYPDSPAEKAGVQPDDILYQVDGENASSLGLEEIRKRILEAGDKGVTLTLVRSGLSNFLEVDVAAVAVEIPIAYHEMLEDNIGYIALYDFNRTSAHQYEVAFADLQEQGMERLIIDLRGNTGGLLSAVTSILNSILPEGIMVYTEDKYGNRQNYMGTGETPLELPMVVLVNSNTASASEIFAGAVRDYDLAKLVGVKTYGKGVVQDLFELSDGSRVKLTISNYYTPNGVNLNDNGLEPDVEVELDTAQKDESGKVIDNQLNAAIETVKEME